MKDAFHSHLEELLQASECLGHADLPACTRVCTYVSSLLAFCKLLEDETVFGGSEASLGLTHR